MVLGIAVAAGYLTGLLRAKLTSVPWQVPTLKYLWLVPVFFLPQLLAFYWPGMRSQMADSLVSICLIVSQAGLLFFCLLNWRLPGLLVLSLGLLLNLIVIVANGGFMPLSTQTAAQLVSMQTLNSLELGSRVGVSKDILLSPASIVFPWLADRFVPPAGFPYRFAFSLGDIFIGMGAFLLLASAPKAEPSLQER